MSDRERLLDLHAHACWWLAQTTPAQAERIKRRIRRYRSAIAALDVLERAA